MFSVTLLKSKLHMKTFLLSFGLIGLLIALLVGCTTMPEPSTSPTLPIYYGPPSYQLD